MVEARGLRVEAAFGYGREFHKVLGKKPCCG
jgi:hypothetical protein